MSQEDCEETQIPPGRKKKRYADVGVAHAPLQNATLSTSKDVMKHRWTVEESEAPQGSQTPQGLSQVSPSSHTSSPAFLILSFGLVFSVVLGIVSVVTFWSCLLVLHLGTAVWFCLLVQSFGFVFWFRHSIVLSYFVALMFVPRHIKMIEKGTRAITTANMMI